MLNAQELLLLQNILNMLYVYVFNKSYKLVAKNNLKVLTAQLLIYYNL